MIWGETKAERNERMFETWTKWFAWVPVELEDGRMAWLQTVYRKRILTEYSSFWSYRPFAPVSVDYIGPKN